MATDTMMQMQMATQPPSFNRHLLWWGGAFLSLLLFGCVIALSYSLGVRDIETGAVPIIRAEGTDIKIRPSDPSGMTFPNQDISIYRKLKGEDNVAKEQLMQEAERPMPNLIEKTTQEQIIALKKKDNLGGEVPAIVQPSVNEASVNNNVKNSVIAPVAVPETPSQTVASIIKQQEKIQEKQVVHPAALAKKVEVKPVPVVKKAEPVTVAKAPQVLVPVSASQVPASMNKPQQLMIPVSKPVAQPANIVPKLAATPAGSGGFLQLGAFKTDAEAKAAWAKIASKQGSVLGGSGSRIIKADLPNGTFYRLQVGPFADRGKTCSTLQSRGQSCMPVR